MTRPAAPWHRRRGGERVALLLVLVDQLVLPAEARPHLVPPAAEAARLSRPVFQLNAGEPVCRSLLPAARRTPLAARVALGRSLLRAARLTAIAARVALGRSLLPSQRLTPSAEARVVGLGFGVAERAL